MADPSIAVLSPHRHPRLRYVLRELSTFCGYRFRLFTDEARWRGSSVDYRLSYGAYRREVPRLPAHPFLSGKPAREDHLAVAEARGIPVFFLDADGRPDLLSCIFFALSRYEEYGPFTPDVHGRFPARASHAHRWGYLQRPVVQEWTDQLLLLATRGEHGLAKKDWSLQLTYDVDIPWAWRFRGWRGWGAGIRDVLTGHWSRARKRLFAPRSRDPFWTFPQLETLHATYGLGVHYFWLVAAGQDRKDPNPFPLPLQLRELMRNLAKEQVCGLHPSYHSSDINSLISSELNYLNSLLDKKINRSRQHFLRFRLPDTYRALYAAGIHHDYSMGYADAVGWRAGTNRPFYWYDLDREKPTGFRVHPFGAMDVTLKNYLKQSADQAETTVLALASATLPYGGPFTLLWHNSSFAPEYGWQGWWEMYQSLIPALLEFRGRATEG